MSNVVVLGAMALSAYGLLSFFAPLPDSTSPLSDANADMPLADQVASSFLLDENGYSNGPGLPVKHRPTQLGDYVPFAGTFFTPHNLNVKYAGYKAPLEPSARGFPQQATRAQVLQMGSPFSQSATGVQRLEERMASVAINTLPYLLDAQQSRMYAQNGKAIPAYQWLGDPREKHQ